MQRRLEHVVQILNRIPPGDGLDLESEQLLRVIEHLLSGLSRSTAPPRTLVRDSLDWLAHKFDVFADAAAKAAGKSIGYAASAGVLGAATYVAIRVDPHMRKDLTELFQLAMDHAN